MKSVYITVPHESHHTILCVLASMVQYGFELQRFLYFIIIVIFTQYQNIQYMSMSEHVQHNMSIAISSYSNTYLCITYVTVCTTPVNCC